MIRVVLRIIAHACPRAAKKSSLTASYATSDSRRAEDRHPMLRGTIAITLRKTPAASAILRLRRAISHDPPISVARCNSDRSGAVFIMGAIAGG
jgi:hypothetical protein